MPKYVITTTQVVVRTYYAEADDPATVRDGIACDFLDEYSQQHGSESIVDVRAVDVFPAPTCDQSVNGTVMSHSWEYGWQPHVDWTLAQ